MLTVFNKLFTETIKLEPDMWLYILIGIVGVAFLIALIVGLASGEFNKVKSLMKRAVADPSKAVACMQRMPVGIKKQYKHARLTGVEPSTLVTERDCVTIPYRNSLTSKIWLVTFVVGVICIAFALFVTPLAVQVAVGNIGEPDTEEAAAALAEKAAALLNASSIVPLVVSLVTGVLTFIGAVVGCGVLNGARKTYAKFVDAIDGKSPVAAAAQQAQAQAQARPAAEQQPVYAQAEPQPADYVEPQPVYAQAEQQPVYAEAYDTKSDEPPVIMPEQPSDDEIRRQAEEALARQRAMEAEQAARAQAQAQAQARAQQMRAQQPPVQSAQPVGSSSADDVIARIEQIDREGAPRETMREVAALLQKERQKPENKTPEQQKKLNEALSKLLKAMSAASRK